MKKPIIGITGSLGLGIYSLQQEHMPAQQHRLSDSYIQAILRAGGIPVILPSLMEEEAMKAMVDALDGVLLSGGGDVDSRLYGKRATGRLGTVSPLRDTAELAVAKYVIRETNKPLLGICRGVQVMNVAMGGTLHIDLPEDGKLCHSLTMYPRDLTSHEVELAAGSRIQKLSGGDRIRVNSFHHEAVETVAEGFKATAWSVPDRVVEAIELPGDRFVVGVQWHPEELTAMEEARGLFRGFVEAAR